MCDSKGVATVATFLGEGLARAPLLHTCLLYILLLSSCNGLSQSRGSCDRLFFLYICIYVIYYSERVYIFAYMCLSQFSFLFNLHGSVAP